jgi:hypothetical protein
MIEVLQCSNIRRAINGVRPMVIVGEGDFSGHLKKKKEKRKVLG